MFGDDGLKPVSVLEGDSVTLNPGFTEMMDDDLIQWRFWIENTLIAEINVTADRFTVYDDVLEIQRQTETGQSNWISDHHRRYS